MNTNKKALGNPRALLDSGDHLLSQAAAHQVPSTAQVLTVVFGMGTGVSPERIITGNIFMIRMGFEPMLPP